MLNEGMYKALYIHVEPAQIACDNVEKEWKLF